MLLSFFCSNLEFVFLDRMLRQSYYTFHNISTLQVTFSQYIQLLLHFDVVLIAIPNIWCYLYNNFHRNKVICMYTLPFFKFKLFFKYNGLREQFDFAHRSPQPSVVITINEPCTSTKLSEQGTRRVVLLPNITGFESSSTPLTAHLSPQRHYHYYRTLHFDQAQRTRYSKGGFASKYNGLREQFDSAHRPPQPSVVTTIIEPCTSARISAQYGRRVVSLRNRTGVETSQR